MATTNASLVSSIKSTNNIQNGNIERLTTDLHELEQLARELETQILMYEMLVNGLPEFGDFSTELAAIASNIEPIAAEATANAGDIDNLESDATTAEGNAA